MMAVFFLALIHLIIMWIFYPEFYLSVDAKRYLEAAHDLMSYGVDPSRWKPHYLLGNSLFIIPGLSLGFDFTFAGYILLHVFSSFLFTLILRRWGLPSFYGILFLLNPSLILFSRTILSETPSVFLIVLALFFYTRGLAPEGGGKRIDIGLGFLFFGLASWVRYTNFFIGGVFLFFYLFRVLKFREAKAFLWTLPFLVGPSLVLLQQKIFYGGFFTNAYGEWSQIFGVSRFLPVFAYYLVLLNVNYPVMLASAFLKGGILPQGGPLRKEVLTSTVLIILIYSFYRWGIQGTNFLERLAGGVRYMLPLFPLLLLPYVNQLEAWRRKLVPAGAGIAAASLIAALVLSDTALAWIHAGKTAVQRNISDDIYRLTDRDSFIVFNLRSEELVNRVLGGRDHTVLSPYFHYDKTRGDEVFRAIEERTSRGEKVYFVYTLGQGTGRSPAGGLGLFGYPEELDGFNLEALLDRYDAIPVHNRNYGPSRLKVYLARQHRASGVGT